jgi:hypothetical protein
VTPWMAAFRTDTASQPSCDAVDGRLLDRHHLTAEL